MGISLDDVMHRTGQEPLTKIMTSPSHMLAHWGLDKMAVISQTPF